MRRTLTHVQETSLCLARPSGGSGPGVLVLHSWWGLNRFFRDFCDRLAAFSMGGHWACWLARRPELPIGATVTFYAARTGDYAGSRSDFLAHFAETDEWVSAAAQESREELERGQQGSGVPHVPGHWSLVLRARSP
jgi:dienelactone hydrolase